MASSAAAAAAAVEDWLDRIELQFALSDTDDKFERVLGASLGKLLLALGHCPKRVLRDMHFIKKKLL